VIGLAIATGSYLPNKTPDKHSERIEFVYCKTLGTHGTNIVEGQNLSAVKH
jgi:hypothetical protein